mmetsp:Transcript_65516/g.207040  ORF Transcript_65516/g.207040 Transcript_65516/m.207040 type:complete len:222 (-) Transcript_65516:217-882(-)
MVAMWSGNRAQKRTRSPKYGSPSSKSSRSCRQSCSSCSISLTTSSILVRANGPTATLLPSLRLRRRFKNDMMTFSACLCLSKCQCPATSSAESAESCSAEIQIGGRPSVAPPGLPVSLLHSSRGSRSPMARCCKLTSCPSSAKGTAGMGASTGSRQSSRAIQSAELPSSQASSWPPASSPRTRLRRLGEPRLISSESAQAKSAQTGGAVHSPKRPEQRKTE